MESDYRTVMREEFISKKMGILEDLEDMKMEAEEKKRKEMRKKRKLWDSIEQKDIQRPSQHLNLTVDQKFI